MLSVQFYNAYKSYKHNVKPLKKIYTNICTWKSEYFIYDKCHIEVSDKQENDEILKIVPVGRVEFKHVLMLIMIAG